MSPPFKNHNYLVFSQVGIHIFLNPNMSCISRMCIILLLQSLSCVWLFETTWTAHEVPLSMDFPGKNTGMGCHFLLQGIFWTQWSNQGLLHWRVDSLRLNYLGSPWFIHFWWFPILFPFRHVLWAWWDQSREEACWRKLTGWGSGIGWEGLARGWAE